MTETLQDRVRRRFLDVNGQHPMTAEDDAYVSSEYVTLEVLAADHGLEADQVRRWMLDDVLPLPSYLRSDGTEMVPRDLLDPATAAGGVDALPQWFIAQFDTPDQGDDEWKAYLSGRYVCLRQVTPTTIKRKDELCAAITAALAAPAPASPSWLSELHALVDELDLLEPDFAPYDRLRFGGPVSRDRCISDVRLRYPRDVKRPVGPAAEQAASP